MTVQEIQFRADRIDKIIMEKDSTSQIKRSKFSTISILIFQRLVSAIAFHPPLATYYLKFISKHKEDGTIKTSLRIELNYVALDILHRQKYESYRRYLSYQSGGYIKPFFVLSSRGNRLLCLSILPPTTERK